MALTPWIERPDLALHRALLTPSRDAPDFEPGGGSAVNLMQNGHFCSFLSGIERSPEVGLSLEKQAFQAFPENRDLRLQPEGFLIYVGSMAHFTTTRRVEFCDTDMGGIIHFSNYYRYMEQAEHDLFRSLGLKIHGQFADGTVYSWPRVAASASFSSPARYDDLLQVRLTILRRSPRSLTISYEFWRDDVRLAIGEMKTAFCKIPSPGKIEAMDMPPEIAGPLDRLMNSK